MAKIVYIASYRAKFSGREFGLQFTTRVAAEKQARAWLAEGLDAWWAPFDLDSETA
jgi:hypothetical protein